MQQILKNMASKTGLFLRANWAYILWGVLHYLLALWVLAGVSSMEQSLQNTTVIYVISIAIAISPIGEFIMRSLERARPVETRQDKDYLLPLFEEVYGEAMQRTPSLSKYIELYITESKSINAFAVGRKTVMLTRGAIDSLSPEELKGIMAHELGHLASGDGIARVITVVGNGLFSIIVLVCKIIMVVFGVIAALWSKRYVLSLIIGFIVHLLFSYSVTAFLFLGDLLIALNNRYREYLADDYAYQIGFGEQLKNTLYQINALDMGGKRSLKDWLKSSHPYTTARIARLEQRLEREQGQQYQYQPIGPQ